MVFYCSQINDLQGRKAALEKRLKSLKASLNQEQMPAEVEQPIIQTVNFCEIDFMIK